MPHNIIERFIHMKKIFLFAAALFAFAACEETPVDNTQEGDKISIAPEKKTFPSQGGSQQVVVTSTGDWTLTAEDAGDWISADLTSGADGDIVTFDVKANTEKEELSAVYTFRCGEATATFTAILSSSEAKTLELTSPSEVEVPYTTEEIQVQLATNANYRALEASVSSGAQDWLSYRVSLEGETAGSAIMVFSLLPNEGSENRSGSITISTEDAEPVTVDVIQRAQPVITPEKSEYVLALEGGSVSIPVDANVGYDVDVVYDEGVSEWLEYKGNESGAEVFSAAASESNRYATVTFTETDPIEGIDPLVASVRVRQTPPALITKALDMTGARAYPAVWGEETKKALTGMTEFTLEALVRADNFKSAGSLSTIMGIEGHFLVRVGDATIPSNRLQIASSSNVTDPAANLETGKWYHIAVTYSSPAHVVTYINGEKVIDGYCGRTSVNFGVDHNDETGYYVTRCFWVGYAYEPARDFEGLMSELRIWDRALTEEEINAENHFYTVDPQSEGLLCYWKLDDGEGNIFKDYTGHGNDLTGEINVRTVGQANIGDPGAQWVDVSLPE